ncbi:MAG: 30S ribosomal protein S1 [Verrucomicrobiales bacterium]|nr:30S ribosomal protein S1 [Verrucomicrobiales bacterium]|tara:strand:+ start:460 stop:2181 length:1722 start_codon:yes stop_codon:yes gene_type:complete
MAATITPSNPELLALIGQQFHTHRENSIVRGKVIEIRTQVVVVDIGAKSEGIIAVSEFEDEEIHVGDEIEVLLEKLENDEGMVVLSKEKAAHKQNWDKIVKVYEDGGLVKGKVKSVVKGGLMVNVGVEAFLPGSQIDIIPPKDLNEYVGNVYEFKIVKVNDIRKNIVLSRREVIEAERAEQRAEFLESVKISDKVEGLVKNITDFGAFIDLQGMDGLLHITDMSWGRINHPSEMLAIGQPLEVIILDVDKEKERVSLGLKQLLDNPWEAIDSKFPIGSEVGGKITKLVPYGAFVELERGVEGLIHVSELSWTKRITRPSDVLSIDQDVKAVVLAINKDEQKISLGVRQLEPNPWDEVETRYPIGSTIKGEIRNLTPYGAFVELEDGIDGMIHVSDLSWTRKINHPSEILKKAEEVEATVLEIDKTNQRISLGVKQLENDPWSEIDTRFKVGDLVKGTVAKIASFGAFIQLEDDIDGLVHISQLSEDHVAKVKDVIKVGDDVEARVIKVDKVERRIGLSIKAAEYSEEQLKKETAAFDALRPSSDLVGLEQAFNLASEEWRPGEESEEEEEATD